MRCEVVASSLQTRRHGVRKRGIIDTGRRTQNTSGTSPRSRDSRRWAWRAPAITVDVDACSLLELVQHLLHPGACFPQTPNPFKLCPTRALRFRLGGATFEPSEHQLSILRGNPPEHRSIRDDRAFCYVGTAHRSTILDVRLSSLRQLGGALVGLL